MTAYEHLAEHYDRLFRLNPDLVAFLDRTLDGLAGRRIVDAGCGTGTLALALAQAGAQVRAVDLDEALLAQAEAKAAGPHPFEVLRGDLRTFPAEPGLDAVLCLGNTLPHLPAEADVAVFLHHARGLVRPGGALVLQLVNYDGLQARGALELPLLETDEVRFRRWYTPLPGGLLRFHTRLEARSGAWGREGSHDLLPLGRDTLDRLLGEGGWRADFAGDWQGGPSSVEAPALVVVARS